MAKGHLSEDTINFIVTAESDQLQQEIHKSIMTGMSPVMDATATANVIGIFVFVAKYLFHTKE